MRRTSELKFSIHAKTSSSQSVPNVEPNGKPGAEFSSSAGRHVAPAIVTRLGGLKSVGSQRTLSSDAPKIFCESSLSWCGFWVAWFRYPAAVRLRPFAVFNFEIS
jgi:hypothetical protein